MSQNASTNPYLLTLPQLISVKKKIGLLAAFYDPEKTSLKGFDAEELNPTQFREQLRRTFGVEITNAELGAIVVYCDKVGNGNISSAEFRKEFFHLGKQERLKHMMSHNIEKTRIAESRKRKEDEREQRMLDMVKFKMGDSWTKEEEESAVRKITEVAFSYDPQSMGGLGGFTNGGDLTPTQFREQLKRNFQVVLSSGELAAIFDKFDSDGDGSIDCSEFLFHFFRMGRTEKDIHRARNAHRTYMQQKDNKQREADSKRKMEAGAQAKIIPSTDDDRLSFEVKLTLAARHYDKKSWLGRSAALDGVAMSPTVFKEQLKQNFDVLVTPAELDAAVKWFNRDGSVPEGMVETKYFLAVFFRLSQAEKSKVIIQALDRKAKIVKAKHEYDKNALEKAQSRAKTKIEWPVLPPAPGSRVATRDGPNRGVSRGASKGKTNSTPPRNNDRPATDSLSALPSFASITSADTNDGGIFGKKEKRVRKASMVEAMDPLKDQREAMKTMSSFGDLFPQASSDVKSFLKDIENKEDAINDITLNSVLESRANTRGGSRHSVKSTKSVKSKKVKKHKKPKDDSRPTSHAASDTTSPDRAQEDVDFAEEMRVQFRPFDDSTNYEDRPLSRHDRASSREKSQGQDSLGGNMGSMFNGSVSSGGESATKPTDIASPAPRQEQEATGTATSPKRDTFQNISLDDVGKNKEFYHKRPVASEGGGVAGNLAGTDDGDTDEYEDDAYEDEFDD